MSRQFPRVRARLFWGPGLETTTGGGDFNISNDEVYDIGKHVDDGEADLVEALDVIDYLDPHKLGETLKSWSNKLAAGGVLRFGGVDIYELSKAIAGVRIDIKVANTLLYGAWPSYPKRCLNNCWGMADFVETEIGLKIMSKEIENFRYIVEAIRE